MKACVSPRAAVDIDEAVAWYVKEHGATDVAQRWRDAAWDAVAEAADDPYRFPVCPEGLELSVSVRQVLIGVGRRATHRLIHSIEDETLLVMMVRHMSQRPLTRRELR